MVAVGAPDAIIGDTGSGVHIVGRQELPKGYARNVKCANHTFRLNTANGRIKTKSVIDLKSVAINRPFEAVILDDSPCAISLGRFCIDHGYSFYWPRGSTAPYLIDERGRRVIFEVDNYVPYVSHASAASLPVEMVEADEDLPQHMWEAPSAGDEAAVRAAEMAEADPPEGGAPKGKVALPPRDLVKEAVSVNHLMTHLPKNPHCSACQRAKIMTKPARRKLKGRRNRKVKRFGDIVTADHVWAKSHNDEGVDYNGIESVKFALVISDHHTDWLECHPAAGKSAEDTRRALDKCKGKMARLLSSTATTPRSWSRPPRT